MRSRLISRLLALLLCLSLVACRSSLKDEVTSALENIDVSSYTAAAIMVPSYAKPSQYTERFPEEYAQLAVYGTDGVPYLLDYVLEQKLDYFNAMFFVCCAYNILGIDEWLNIDRHRPDEHARALQAYLP